MGFVFLFCFVWFCFGFLGFSVFWGFFFSFCLGFLFHSVVLYLICHPGVKKWSFNPLCVPLQTVFWSKSTHTFNKCITRRSQGTGVWPTLQPRIWVSCSCPSVSTWRQPDHWTAACSKGWLSIPLLPCAPLYHLFMLLHQNKVFAQKFWQIQKSKSLTPASKPGRREGDVEPQCSLGGLLGYFQVSHCLRLCWHLRSS